MSKKANAITRKFIVSRCDTETYQILTLFDLHCEEAEAELATMKAEIEEKDKWLFAYEQTRTPRNPVHARLLERVVELEVALKPFAEAAGQMGDDRSEVMQKVAWKMIPNKSFRKAAKVLAKGKIQ